MKKENSGKEVLLDPELIRKLVVGIGEVSDITGVPTRKIRYWEEKGIITSEHNSEGETRKYNFFNIKKIIIGFRYEKTFAVLFFLLWSKF